VGKGTFATAFPGAGGAAGVEGGTDAVDDAGAGAGAGTGAGAGAVGAVDAVSSLGALPSEYAAAIAASADPSATSSPIDPGSIIFNG